MDIDEHSSGQPKSFSEKARLSGRLSDSRAEPLN
jgi:hypothetical protein